MSTHAAIVTQTPEGEYRGIYVHHDGYPSHTGAILTEHYKTEEQIAELIDLGDLSSLGATIEQSIAYHRDRGEKKRITGSENLHWVVSKIDWDYLYLWAEGAWHKFSQPEYRDLKADEARQAEGDSGWDPTA
jgi:hypothetical protein